MSDWPDLAGRAVVVAGAGGLGGACAAAMAAAGARVLAVDVDDQALEALRGSAGVEVLRSDLGTADACRAAVGRAVSTLGRVDVFVHAVGINDRRPVLDVPDDLWQRIVTLNLSSAFWCGQAVGRQMCAAGHGRMVFLSSVSGWLAHADHGPYAASKGGLNQLVRVMAREWAPHGVTVNAVAPGYTETDLTSAYLAKPGVRERMVGQVPAGRLGTVEDVVGPVLFLSSDRSAFVTGHVLYVDGGRLLV